MAAVERGVNARILLDQQEYHSPYTSIANVRHDEALAMTRHGVLGRSDACQPSHASQLALVSSSPLGN